MISLLDGGGGEAFKLEGHDGDGLGGQPSIMISPRGGGGTGLAAAAKIERGIPLMPPSP